MTTTPSDFAAFEKHMRDYFAYATSYSLKSLLQKLGIKSGL